MALARCANQDCNRVLDIPGYEASYHHIPTHTCAKCAGFIDERGKLMPGWQQEVAKLTGGKAYEVQTMPDPDKHPKIEISSMPVPNRGAIARQAPVYPFAQMKPPKGANADSFMVPIGKKMSTADQTKLRTHILHNAKAWAKRTGTKAKFVTRKVEENGVIGIRVWRVE